MRKDKILKALKEYFTNINFDVNGKNQSITDVIDYIKESNKLVFLLQDNTVMSIKLHLVDTELDIIQLAIEDLKSYEQYNKKIRTVVICGSNVNKIKEEVNIGQDIYYKIDTVYLKEYDGDNIYDELENKISTKSKLDDKDKINLILLPLMKSEHSSEHLLSNILNLIKKIENYNIRDLYISIIKIIYDDLIK